MSNETARREAVDAFMVAQAGRRSGNPRTGFLAGWDAAVKAERERVGFLPAPAPLDDEGPRSSGWYNADSDDWVGEL